VYKIFFDILDKNFCVLCARENYNIKGILLFISFCDLSLFEDSSWAEGEIFYIFIKNFYKKKEANFKKDNKQKS
jgi:hypothetical protein